MDEDSTVEQRAFVPQKICQFNEPHYSEMDRGNREIETAETKRLKTAVDNQIARQNAQSNLVMQDPLTVNTENANAPRPQMTTEAQPGEDTF